MGARIEGLVHHVAHIEQQGLHLVAVAVLLLEEGSLVGVIVRRNLEDELGGVTRVAQVHDAGGHLTLCNGRLVYSFKVCDQVRG